MGGGLKHSLQIVKLELLLVQWRASSRPSSCALYYSTVEMLRTQLEHFVRESQRYSMYYLHTHIQYTAGQQEAPLLWAPLFHVILQNGII